MLLFKKIGFLGVGNMAQALVTGLVEQSQVPPKKIFLYGKNPKKVQTVKDKYPEIGISFSDVELVREVDVLFLCVKPHQMSALLDSIRGQFPPHQILVSVAAAFPLEHPAFPSAEEILRLMPNLFVKEGQAVLGYFYRETVSAEAKDRLEGFVREYLKPMGQLYFFEKESLFELSTIMGGSGISFAMEIMNYASRWMVDQGYSEQEGKKMIAQVFRSVADKFPQEDTALFHQKVRSKGGVTQEGLRAFEERQMEESLRYAYESCLLKIEKMKKDIC